MKSLPSRTFKIYSALMFANPGTVLPGLEQHVVIGQGVADCHYTSSNTGMPLL